MGLLVSLLDWSVRLEYWGPLPNRQELSSHSYSKASEVYTIDGELLGRYFFKDRTMLSSAQIPRILKDALLATEDIRFYEHNGVDHQSLFRVVFKGMLGRDPSAGGGSTLTQQLAKQWYPRETYPFGSLMFNKFREMEIARRLEAIFSKEEILEHYINTVYLSDHAFGFETASQHYFGHGMSELELNEACILVGMLKAPTTYNPVKNPDRARERRNIVVRQMQKYHFLTSSKADSLVALPLNLSYHPITHHDGLAPYFRSYLRQFLNEFLKDIPKPGGGNWNIYKDGLKIITPIHSSIQRYAEESVMKEMQRIQKNFYKEQSQWSRNQQWKKLFPEKKKASTRYKAWKKEGYSEKEIDSLFRIAVPMQLFSYEGMQDTLMSPYDSMQYSNYLLHPGFCAMDPSSGFIRAWVGGLNHQAFQFDHVLSRRQAGSAFKPLVYATALENGLDPCTPIPNERTTYRTYGNWRPSNSDQLYGGEYSMEGALTHSVNVVAVKMVLQTGPKAVCQMVEDMGIPYPLPEVPSIALGSGEIALQDLLSAYCTIANKGIRTRPRPLVRIETPDGTILYDATAQLLGGQVISEKHAAMLLHMMQSVINMGTGKRLRNKYKLNLDLAGKTGTTQKQTDGWFLGVSPYLAAGAWVGADDQRIHFKNMSYGQGASTALPIFGTFMKKLLQDEEFAAYEDAAFPALKAAWQAELDCPGYSFPIQMEDFRQWWYSQYGGKDSLMFDGTMYAN